MSKRNYFTTVDLTTKGPADYQFIYGSQLYQTSFGVYGKFHCENKAIVKIDFEIINYKGCVNIGFVDPSVTWNPSEKTITLYLRALSQINEATLNIDNLVLEVEDKYDLRIDRMLKPYAHESYSDLREDKGSSAGDTSFFDSEFYYRDGIDEEIKILRAGQYVEKTEISPYQSKQGHKIIDKILKNKHRDFASPRCHYSNVRLRL